MEVLDEGTARDGKARKARKARKGCQMVASKAERGIPTVCSVGHSRYAEQDVVVRKSVDS